MAFNIASLPTGLLETVYPLTVTPLSRSKDKPLKVLALGLGRCGTDSLRAALDQLGYENTYHGWRPSVDDVGEAILWCRLLERKYSNTQKDGSGCEISAEDFDEILGESEAVTDFPCSMFAAELIRAYPDAKVIINGRDDVDAWYRSMSDVFITLRNSWTNWWESFWEPHNFWVRTLWHRMMFPLFYHGGIDRTAKWRYAEHYAMLRGLVPEHQRLEWKVQDGWEPLCDFLGKPVPAGEFPSGNATKETLDRAMAIRTKTGQATNRNMFLVGSTTIALIGAGIWTSRKLALS